MISEMDLLRQEKKFGAGNLVIEVLKAQLKLLLNQKEQQRHKDQHHHGECQL